MNLFQRLSYLKNWYDENHTLYIDNRKLLETAFHKKYKNELRRYILESKRIKQKRTIAIQKEKSITYQNWVEIQFQKLLQKLSQTIVDFQKTEYLEQFDNWLKDFAPLDYKFRVYTLELYYKVELTRFNSQFDSYIIALKEGLTDWLLKEDERYNLWIENHPLYKELQELEYQYDSIVDDNLMNQNYSFMRNAINLKNFQQRYIPTSKENLTISVAKPSLVKPHTPSYF